MRGRGRESGEEGERSGDKEGGRESGEERSGDGGRGDKVGGRGNMQFYHHIWNLRSLSATIDTKEAFLSRLTRGSCGVNVS